MSPQKVIVVGGGVIGTSTALHLLRAGADVTLVERDKVAQGTSSAGAGFVDPWTLGAPSGDGAAEEAVLAEYGIEFYRSLHERVPESPFRQKGLLWMAASEEDWPYVEKRLTEGPSDARAVDPAEIEELTHGVVQAAGVFRGVLRPSSAQISAERATRAVAKLFVEEGGTLLEHSPVDEILTRGGTASGVRIGQDTLEADAVVVTAGAWTNQLFTSLGVFLPLAPLMVSRIVTEPLGLPGDLPLLFVRSKATGMPRSYWLREEDGRLMFGTVYETPARYSFVDNAVPERLDEVNLDGVLAVQKGAEAFAAAVPALTRYQNMRLKHGAPVFTPDGRPLVGKVPDIENLHVIAGCNEQGVTNGPGFGRVMSDLIMNGSTELTDTSVWSFDRFDRSYQSVKEVVDAIG